nr:PREDICTED: homeobox protein ESX1-like isoform X1 [Paralichthys olivaceus]XP_019936030.1 PREDICTED: homeobox protein ESX1-like isoform X1 [Paralichthys olivaceus]
MRKQPGSQRAQTGSLRTTEYQEKLCDPSSYKTLVFTVPQADLFHPLAGTKYMPMTTFRKKYIRCKQMKVPPKAPTPVLPPESPETPGPFLPLEAPMPSLPPEDPEPSWLPEAPKPSWLPEAPKPSWLPEYQLPPWWPKVPDSPRFITTYKSDFVVHPLQPRESPLKITSTLCLN